MNDTLLAHASKGQVDERVPRRLLLGQVRAVGVRQEQVPEAEQGRHRQREGEETHEGRVEELAAHCRL